MIHLDKMNGNRSCSILCLIVVFLALCCILVQTQTLGQNPCVSKVTCRECIQTKSCAWCMQEEFGDRPRCFQPSYAPGICPEQYTFSPNNVAESILIKNLTRGGNLNVESRNKRAADGDGNYMTSGSSWSSSSSSSSNSSGRSGSPGSYESSSSYYSSSGGPQSFPAGGNSGGSYYASSSNSMSGDGRSIPAGSSVTYYSSSGMSGGGGAGGGGGSGGFGSGGAGSGNSMSGGNEYYSSRSGSGGGGGGGSSSSYYSSSSSGMSGGGGGGSGVSTSGGNEYYSSRFGDGSSSGGGGSSGSYYSSGGMSGGSGGGLRDGGSSSSYYSNSSYTSSSSQGGTYTSTSSFSSSSEIVQLSPQRVKCSLRVGEEYPLKFKYSQAEDYPVDLYYLMDLSKSMEDDKAKLSSLGDELAATMKRITSNFRLGFGSFVDKVLMPYVSTIPHNLHEPCTGCAAPYGYHNVMALSMDTRRFATEVKNAAVSGNLDAPEGGFDAIMQAIVCRQQIGWREKARRVLVFSTDAGFHYAGDGKLGGVIAPNDGICHLDTNGTYTHSKIQDYPSISQINTKVKEHHINVIFAVTAQQQEVYKLLSEHIQGSSSATLSSDSSNVVQLVQEEYNKITSSIEMKDNATGPVKITYYSSCLTNGKPIQTNKCDNLKVGQVVSFEARIIVTECPTNPKDWFQTIHINPVGIDESLIVDLEMICSCPCEHGGDMYEKNSPKCNNHGIYQCGICDCGPNYYGRKCECSALDIHKQVDRDMGCRPDNVTQVDCNGRGNCVCGVCECEKRPYPDEIISGKFCECDNFSCDRHNQNLCSGPEHGTCECGQCVCKPGWIGSACDCRATTDTCIPPKGGEICSGHGECVCGVCQCKVSEEGRYSGAYCENCPTCSGRCEELKECVQCQAYKTGPLKEGNLCATNCTLFTPSKIDKLEVNEEIGEHLCSFYDEDDCRYQFIYTDKDDKLEVRAEERKCPPKVFMLGIVLAVIAAIVLFGLAILLLWKLFTTIHDRREFARFEKERMMAKWDTGENPIYKQATSTFKNPTYVGK